MTGYSVYKHTSPSGKVYIGITSKKPEKRWDNGNGYRDCPHMARAVAKYGWRQFTHEILAEGLSKEETEATEVQLIAEYQSNNANFGYNIDNGGNAPGKTAEATRRKMSASRMGHPTSAETRRKLSAAHKGVPLSPEHLAAIRAASAKRRGAPLPEETRRKISEAIKGRVKSPEECRRISEARKGKLFHSEETRRKISETKKSSPETPRGANNRKSRKVVCVETGEVFECITGAAAAKGIKTARNIGRSCKRGDRCGGYHWRYYEDCNSTNKDI